MILYLNRGFRLSEVDGFAGGEQQEIIKDRENLTARLVDGGDDGSASVCYAPESLNDEESRGTVKTSGWLIKEQKTWLRYDLEGDAEPLLLAAADPSKMPVTNEVIRAVSQSHFGYGVLYDIVHLLLCKTAWKPEGCRVCDAFFHR